MVMRMIQDWSPPDRFFTRGPYPWSLSFIDMEYATVLRQMR